MSYKNVEFRPGSTTEIEEFRITASPKGTKITLVGAGDQDIYSALGYFHGPLNGAARANTPSTKFKPRPGDLYSWQEAPKPGIADGLACTVQELKASIGFIEPVVMSDQQRQYHVYAADGTTMVVKAWGHIAHEKGEVSFLNKEEKPIARFNYCHGWALMPLPPSLSPSPRSDRTNDDCK